MQAGKLAAGAATGAVGLSIVACGQAAKPAGQAAAATAAPAAAPTVVPAAKAAENTPAWPWPYVQLDPQEVAQRAYDGYYQGACMYGAFNAIVGALRDKVGYPYTLTRQSRNQKGCMLEHR